MPPSRSRGAASDPFPPLPVRRVQRHPLVDPLAPDHWPATLAPVAQVLREGLDLGSATVLVGANGTGKSTLIEAIAMAFGLAPEGGSTGARHRSYASESPLHESLQLVRGPGASRWGYFVRAETMHGLVGYLDATATESFTRDPTFHRFSHGESFMALLGTRRFAGEGFFVMDEPEAGLSFEAQLTLVGALTTLASRRGAQVLIATHSPIVSALPGARILQLDALGIHPVNWDDLAVVDHYRRFFADPRRYLRHVVGD